MSKPTDQELMDWWESFGGRTVLYVNYIPYDDLMIVGRAFPEMQYLIKKNGSVSDEAVTAWWMSVHGTFTTDGTETNGRMSTTNLRQLLTEHWNEKTRIDVQVRKLTFQRYGTIMGSCNQK